MYRTRFLTRLIAVVAMLVAWPLSVAWAEQAMILPVDPAPLVVDTGKEQVSFKVEIADDGSERSRGLMFRTEMPADHGMLFVFQMQQPLAFWMKNTALPLDLVFIDSKGQIKAVLPGTPFSEAPISPGPGVPVQYVLELNHGTAARLGIDPGDMIRHPLIDEKSTVQ
jgi:uncharacterized membrane protein (UPF0127 family)